MKKIIIMLVVGLLVQQIIQAQGTIYLSNLAQPSAGSESVGNDSWLAAQFETGANADGYELNSIQLAMAAASGDPNGFTVMLYKSFAVATAPEASIGSLSGSSNPSTSGIYTFTDDSDLTLSPDTTYFIVLTAGTAVTSGAYEFSVTSASSYNSSGGWQGGISLSTSSNGLSPWSLISGDFPQYAISATAVPEPGVLSLAVAGGLFLIWHRRKTSRC